MADQSLHIDPTLIGSVFRMRSFVVSGPEKKPKVVGVGGGGVTPLCGLYRYAQPKRVGFSASLVINSVFFLEATFSDQKICNRVGKIADFVHFTRSLDHSRWSWMIKANTSLKRS